MTLIEHRFLSLHIFYYISHFAFLALLVMLKQLRVPSYILEEWYYLLPCRGNGILNGFVIHKHYNRYLLIDNR